MKFIRINFLALFFSIFLLASCKEEDKEAPAIILNGDQNVSVGVNTQYIELGATATDSEDGILAPLIKGLVNTNSAKTYTLSYSVADKSGNNALVYRYVTVKNLVDYLAGTYTTHKIGFDTLSGFASDSSDYSQVVGFSLTVNNRITFTKFGNNTFAPSSTKINGDVDLNQTALVIPLQSANIISVKHYYRGNGTISGDSLMFITYYDSLPGLKAKKFTLNMKR